MHSPLKWALYARKSTESEERQIQSIPDQIKFFTEVAFREGLEIAETISESRTAKLPNNRIGFAALIKLIEKGKIDGILCWKLNRLARNPVDAGLISWLLQTGKIKCIKTSERCYYPTDNVLLFAVELGMANQEVRELAKNVARGLESKADKGWYPSVPPTGYLNSKWRKKGEEQILVDNERFPLVRKMWDLMLTGSYTPSEILRIATKEWKLDTPKRKGKGQKPLAPSAVYKLFSNIFYTGNFTYKGKVYRGNHQAMVTPGEFERVQMLLGRKTHIQPIIHDFPYTGIMKCANCGASITATVKRKLVKKSGEYKTYTYYHCTRRIGIDDCREPPVTLNELEGQIASILREYSISPRFYQLGLEVFAANLPNDTNEHEAVQNKHLSAAKEIKTKLDKLLKYLLSDTISEADYAKQKKELEQELALTNTKMDEIDAIVESDNEQVKKVFHFSHYALNALKTGDPKTKRSLLLNIGSNWKLNQKNLCIDIPKWFIKLKEHEKQLNSEIDRFELEITNNDNAKSLFFKYSSLLKGQ